MIDHFARNVTRYDLIIYKILFVIIFSDNYKDFAKCYKRNIFWMVLSDSLCKFYFTVEFMMFFVENLLGNVLSFNKESIFKRLTGNMLFYHVLTVDRLKAKYI